VCNPNDGRWYVKDAKERRTMPIARADDLIFNDDGTLDGLYSGYCPLAVTIPLGYAPHASLQKYATSLNVRGASIRLPDPPDKHEMPIWPGPSTPTTVDVKIIGFGPIAMPAFDEPLLKMDIPVLKPPEHQVTADDVGPPKGSTDAAVRQTNDDYVNYRPVRPITAVRWHYSGELLGVAGTLYAHMRVLGCDPIADLPDRGVYSSPGPSTTRNDGRGIGLPDAPGLTLLQIPHQLRVRADSQAPPRRVVRRGGEQIVADAREILQNEREGTGGMPRRAQSQARPREPGWQDRYGGTAARYPGQRPTTLRPAGGGSGAGDQPSRTLAPLSSTGDIRAREQIPGMQAQTYDNAGPIAAQQQQQAYEPSGDVGGANQRPQGRPASNQPGPTVDPRFGPPDGRVYQPVRRVLASDDDGGGLAAASIRPVSQHYGVTRDPQTGAIAQGFMAPEAVAERQGGSLLRALRGDGRSRTPVRDRTPPPHQRVELRPAGAGQAHLQPAPQRAGAPGPHEAIQRQIEALPKPGLLDRCATGRIKAEAFVRDFPAKLQAIDNELGSATNPASYLDFDDKHPNEVNVLPEPATRPETKPLQRWLTIRDTVVDLYQRRSNAQSAVQKPLRDLVMFQGRLSLPWRDAEVSSNGGPDDPPVAEHVRWSKTLGTAQAMIVHRWDAVNFALWWEHGVAWMDKVPATLATVHRSPWPPEEVPNDEGVMVKNTRYRATHSRNAAWRDNFFDEGRLRINWEGRHDTLSGRIEGELELIAEYRQLENDLANAAVVLQPAGANLRPARNRNRDRGDRSGRGGGNRMLYDEADPWDWEWDGRSRRR
jgi:hypothetical protein